jgi:hypothetical protein
VERGEVAGVREGRQQGRSIARATRGLGRPSLDARSLAQPYYPPEENHRPPEGEKEKETNGQRHPSSHDVPDWEETKDGRP